MFGQWQSSKQTQCFEGITAAGTVPDFHRIPLHRCGMCHLVTINFVPQRYNNFRNRQGLSCKKTILERKRQVCANPKLFCNHRRFHFLLQRYDDFGFLISSERSLGLLGASEVLFDTAWPACGLSSSLMVMSFVQKEDVLIVLDETHLSFATFVLPKFHHFKFGLFDVSNSIWIQMLQ